MIRRGALVVFEGCDRSGKTTQCQKLIQSLRDEGTPVEFMRFPDRSTVIGGLINSYLTCGQELDDHAIHLLFSANRWEMVSTMKKHLFQGTCVIVDRYSYSGVAFSSAKTGMSMQWCKQPEVGLPKPDAVIFLDLDPTVANQRGEYGAERYESTDFQKTVRDNYFLLKDETWQVIDASQPIDEVHQDVRSIVQNAIKSVQNSTLLPLWTETPDCI